MPGIVHHIVNRTGILFGEWVKRWEKWSSVQNLGFVSQPNFSTKLSIIYRLSSKRELGEKLTKEFFVPVLRKWIELINSDDCSSHLLDPIITFVENVSPSIADRSHPYS